MATSDDVLNALLRMEAAASQTGGITNSILQGLLANSQSLLAAFQAGQGNNSGGSLGNSGVGGGGKQKKQKGILRSLGNMFSKGGRGLATAAPKGGVGALAKGGLGRVAAMAGPAGAAAALVVGLVEAADAAKKFAYEQEASIRKLAQVSPSQATNLARLDTNRVYRDIKTGEGQADSGKQLTEAIDRFENATQPLEQSIGDLKNTIGANLMDILGSVMVSITEGVNAVRELLGKDPLGANKGPEIDLFGDSVRRIAQEQRTRGIMAQEKIDAMRKADERFRGR